MCYTWASERPISSTLIKRRCTESCPFHKYSSEANFRVALNVKERCNLLALMNGGKKALRSFKGFYRPFVNYKMATFKMWKKWHFCSQDVRWQNETTKDWHVCGRSNPLSISTVSQSELRVRSELPFRKLLQELNRCHTPGVISYKLKFVFRCMAMSQKVHFVHYS